MRRKLWFGAMAAGLALVTTACFGLQGFSVLDSSLSAGQATKVQFALRPFSATADKHFQFVMVGVDSTDLAIGKATWGTNGKFTGPVPMPVSVPLPGVLTTGSTCSSSALGIDLSTASGVTWKAFLTPTKIADKGLVDSVAQVQVGLKAKSTAATDTAHEVIGVTGAWQDNTSGGTLGVPDATDAFLCTGLSTDSVYVKA